MKLKTGDKVKFLNDTGGGIFVSFIDKNMALIRIDDGFEIPVMISELVTYGDDYFGDEQEKEEKPEKPELRKSTSIIAEKKIEKPKPTKASLVVDDEIVFAAKPSEKHAGINTWLVNSSSWSLKYLISRPVEDGHQLFAEGILEPDTKVYLRRFSPPNIHEIEVFDFQFLFCKESVYTKRDPLDIRVFIDPEGIFNGEDLHQNDYFNGKAFISRLVDFKKRKVVKTTYPDIKDLDKIVSQKNDIPQAIKKEEKIAAGDKIEEIDLHIENLVDSHQNMSNGEILEIQMGRFKTSLETAIIHKVPKIVFIHGVGNGKLKFEIRKTLDQKYPHLQYQDASFREYGYGATMVLMKA